MPWLAWPFGLTDDGLMAQATESGYDAAFALGARPVTRAAPPYALPRTLVADALDERRLARLLDASFASPTTN